MFFIFDLKSHWEHVIYPFKSYRWVFSESIPKPDTILYIYFYHKSHNLILCIICAIIKLFVLLHCGGMWCAACESKTNFPMGTIKYKVK